MTDPENQDGQPSHAPADTTLGAVQRGRGDGFLAVLAMPSAEAHALLLGCITHDARFDLQTNSRGEYLAELVLATGCDLRPVEAFVRAKPAERDARLARETMQALARWSDARAIAFLREDLVRVDSIGEHLCALIAGAGIEACADVDAILCEAFDDERLGQELWEVDDHPGLLSTWSASNPRIARLLASERQDQERLDRTKAERAIAIGAEDFADLLMALGYERACDPRALGARATVEHVDLLVDVLQPGMPRRLRAALYALTRLGGAESERAILAAAARQHEMRSGEVGSMIRALGTLPAERVLPLARVWARRRTHPLEITAASLLAQHATETDVELVVGELQHALREYGHYTVAEWLTALARFPGRGWLPGVEESYRELPCSQCRTDAVRTLIALDPERFARTYAADCLWDCEAATVEEAIPLAPIDDPRVRARLEELARPGALRDEDTRAAAAARLA